MSHPSDDAEGHTLTKGASWVGLAFYALIAFEFFYMAGPFAAYFYAVYGPGLGMLADNPTASELLAFFLPHIAAQTTSPLVDAHTAVGGVLFLAGLIGFGVGAIQIYVNKLRRGADVQRGIYRWIRHPQYLALIVSSFGMLLVWPRFLILFGFVTLVFIYVALARAEERQCLRQFPGYAAYRQATGMFLPRVLEAPIRWLPKPTSRLGRAAGWLTLYLAALGLTHVGAHALQGYAVRSLYSAGDEGSVTISVGQMSPGDISRIVTIATTDPVVSAALESARAAGDVKLLNYVLPTGVFISEIPMNLPPGAHTGHSFPRQFDRSRYKIIFTRDFERRRSPGQQRHSVADTYPVRPCCRGINGR